MAARGNANRCRGCTLAARRPVRSRPHFPHPIIIQRLELLSPDNNTDVFAYQVTMPHQLATNLPRIGGILPAGASTGVEAVLREALTNPSPYYRLLLAYRGFEGITRIHREFAAFVKKNNVEAPPLEAVNCPKNASPPPSMTIPSWT
jgi:hypothetical protein